MDYKHIYSGLEDLPPILTEKEVANVMRVSPMTVINWIKEKNLPAFKIGNCKKSAVRILKADFLAWLGNHSTAKE